MAGPSSSSSLLLSLGLSDTNVYEPEMSVWHAVCGGDSDGAAHHALPPLDDHVSPRPYPTQSVDKVVFQESIPTQMRQLILYIIDDNGEVDEFVRELTFAKLLCKQFL